MECGAEKFASLCFRHTRWSEIPWSHIPLELKHCLSIIRVSNGSLDWEAIWNKVRQIADSLAAPATVCGEQLLTEATGKLGRQSTSIDPQARKPAIASVTQPPNGVFWWDGYPFSVARQFVLTAKGHRNMGLPSKFHAVITVSQSTGFKVNVRAEPMVLPFYDQSSAITKRRSNVLSLPIVLSHLARIVVRTVIDLGLTLTCLSIPIRNESSESQKDNEQSGSSATVPTKQEVAASVSQDLNLIEDDSATILSTKNLKQFYGSEARSGKFNYELFVIPGIRV